MEGLVHQLSKCFGICARIKQSPVPAVHTAFMRVFGVVYCLIAPWSLATTLGIAGPILVQFIFSFILFGVQDVAELLESPFGLHECNLPLDIFCGVIRSQCYDAVERYDEGGQKGVKWKLADGPVQAKSTPLSRAPAGPGEVEIQSDADALAQIYASRPRQMTTAELGVADREAFDTLEAERAALQPQQSFFRGPLLRSTMRWGGSGRLNLNNSGRMPINGTSGQLPVSRPSKAARSTKKQVTMKPVLSTIESREFSHSLAPVPGSPNSNTSVRSASASGDVSCKATVDAKAVTF